MSKYAQNVNELQIRYYKYQKEEKDEKYNRQKFNEVSNFLLINILNIGT